MRYERTRSPQLGWRPVVAACALVAALAGQAAARGGRVPMTMGTVAAQATDNLVRSVTVEGNQRYTDDQLLSALGIRVGEPLDAEQVDKVGVRVVFERFHSRVEIYRRTLDPAEGGGIAVRVVVTELAVDLEPRFVGNVEIDDDELYEWAELSERSELYVPREVGLRSERVERVVPDEVAQRVTADKWMEGVYRREPIESLIDGAVDRDAARGDERVPHRVRRLADCLDRMGGRFGDRGFGHLRGGGCVLSRRVDVGHPGAEAQARHSHAGHEHLEVPKLPFDRCKSIDERVRHVCPLMSVA